MKQTLSPYDSERIIVAVYGSLKRNFYNHHFLEVDDTLFLADAQVSGFSMYSLGSYPMIVKGNGIVSVELYDVSRETFSRLDRLEGFPTFYGRSLVTAETLHCPVEAWIYFGKQEQVRGCKRVSSGVWQQVPEQLLV